MRNLDLEQRMEAALMDEAAEGDDPYGIDLPRASTIASACARQVYYAAMKVPRQPMDVYGAASTTGGKALESHVLDHLDAALGVKGERQVRVQGEWFVGTADWWHAPSKTLADSKTANVASWQIKRREDSPGDSYIMQQTIYADALGATRILVPIRAVGTKIADTLDKAGKPIPLKTGIYTVFEFKPDPAVLARAKEIAEFGRSHAIQAGLMQADTPPPRAYERTYWLCRAYCPFRDHCWGTA